MLSEFYANDDIILIPVTTTALALGGVELMTLMKLISLIFHR